MNLDELEKLARAATPGYWDDVFGDIEQYIMVTVEGRDVYSPKNADYIAAANPQTVLKLIAVARAAPKGCTCGIAIGDPRIKEHPEHCRKLMEALEALNDI